MKAKATIHWPAALFHVGTTGSVVFAALFLWMDQAYAAWGAVASVLLAAIGAYASRLEGALMLKEQTGWRELEPGQFNAIVSDLKARPFAVEVDWSHDQESEHFARQIIAALHAAGCEVKSNGAVAPKGAYWKLLGPGPAFDDRIEAQ